MSRQRTRFDELRRTASRRPGILPGRRFALALALALVLAGCWGGVAWGDNSDQSVTAFVYPPSGGLRTQSIFLSTLENHCTPPYSGRQIDLYRQDGTLQPAQTYTTAWSVGTVLGCMNLTGVLKVLVEQAGAPELSQNSQLLPADLTYPNPSDFNNPSEAPLIYSDGGGIGYLRPSRGSGDANAADSVYDPYNTPFQLEVFQRTVLGATVTPSANPVAVGATVTFTAQAPGMGSGLSYSWDFGGAAPSSTTPSPSVTYTAAGTYSVVVQVTDSANDVSQSNPLLIRVGTAPPTNPNPNAPLQGPNASHGQTPNGRPSHHSNPGTTTGHGNHGHANGTSPTTTTQPGSTSSGSGSGAGTGTGSGSSSTGTAASQNSAGRRRASHGHAARGGGHATHRRATSTIGPAVLVTGRLISDVVPVAANRSPLVHAVPASLATAPSARRPAVASILPALAAALGVVLLFSLGAGRELRSLRPWRLLRFSS